MRISAFQPSHTSGPTAPRSAAVSTKSICSTSGEPTCTAKSTTVSSSLVSRRKARWFMRRCLWTRNFSRSRLRVRQAEPPRRPLGDPQADLAMVLQKALAQVVDQQRQVQHALVGDAAVDASQRPLVAGQFARRTPPPADNARPPCTCDTG